MVIDHIALFTGIAPIWFHWLGRLSAPIFVFLVCYSIDYTRDINKYTKRLYISSVLMSVMYIILQYTGVYITDFYLNIFRTLFTTVVFIRLIEMYKAKDKDFKKYVKLYIAMNILAVVLIFVAEYISFSGYAIGAFILTITGSIIDIEGGMPFVLLGVVIYYNKDDKKKLAVSYVLYCLAYYLVLELDIIPRIAHINFMPYWFNEIWSELVYIVTGISFMEFHLFSIHNILYENYQWMMVFAIPFMLMYNNKKGKAHKYFFYIGYPLHIVILIVICNYYNLNPFWQTLY